MLDVVDELPPSAARGSRRCGFLDSSRSSPNIPDDRHHRDVISGKMSVAMREIAKIPTNRRDESRDDAVGAFQASNQKHADDPY